MRQVLARFEQGGRVSNDCERLRLSIQGYRKSNQAKPSIAPSKIQERLAIGRFFKKLAALHQLIAVDEPVGVGNFFKACD